MSDKDYLDDDLGGLARSATPKADNNQVDNLHLLFQGEGTQTACTCGKSFGMSELAQQHQTLMNTVVLERERRRLYTTPPTPNREVRHGDSK